MKNIKMGGKISTEKVDSNRRVSWVFGVSLSFVFILCYMAFEFTGLYRVRIILVIIIYLSSVFLWFRWLKLGFTTVVMNDDLRMYYNNLSLLLMNMTLFSFMFFTIISKLDLPDEVLRYIEEKKMSSISFLIGVIIFLFLVAVIIAVAAFKLRKNKKKDG